MRGEKQDFIIIDGDRGNALTFNLFLRSRHGEFHPNNTLGLVPPDYFVNERTELWGSFLTCPSYQIQVTKLTFACRISPYLKAALGLRHWSIKKQNRNSELLCFTNFTSIFKSSLLEIFKVNLLKTSDICKAESKPTGKLER